MAFSTHLSISSSHPLQHPTFPLTPRKQKKPPSTTINASSSSSPPPTPSIADALTAAGKLLWGRSLPPQLLVSTARSSWTFAWRLMMKQLAPSDPAGAYSRPPSAFPLPSPSPSSPPRRLHLYAALPCPWAHRTLIVRALKRLHHAVPLSLASPGSDGSWQFPDPAGDRACGRRTLKEVYKLRPGGFDRRATVPMLWDVEKGDVFCNESYDIAEFFNSGLAGESLDLSPPELKEKIDHWNRIIYPSVNNGVYRCCRI